MDKMKMHSPDLTAENIEKLAALFPQCLVECKDADGKIVRKIDFEALQQELSGAVIDGSHSQERYVLNWPGKRKAVLLANSPVAKTLRPCRKESVDFDHTQNLYIEGDNLDVLKLLRDTYLGKVKMIYIDPPYNTGNDFIYRDNFSKDGITFSDESEAPHWIEHDKDCYGSGTLEANPASKGRYHSDWLTMMYPRLRLAHQLLCDDGVIFISIDDNEVHNLRKACDEVFGEENFIAIITRETIKGGSLSKNLRQVHDYILSYGKNKFAVSFSGHEKDEIELDREDENGKYAKGRELNKWGAGSRREDSPSMWFPIKGPNSEEVFPYRNDGSEGRWRLGKKKMEMLVKNNDIIFEKREDGTFIAYEKIRGNKTGIKQFTTLFRDLYVNAKGTERIKDLFKIERSYFNYAKPIELLNALLIMSDVDSDDIVLDFFSGSATTADAIMKLNAEDGGNRKFIMVQLPEACAPDSEAFKAGYKNICEIGKERIRRAGAKILEEWKTQQDKKENDLFAGSNEKSQLDIGFRVLKLDSSNMEDVYYTPDAIDQDMLAGLVDNVKPDRTAEDLLFQVMLDWGVELSVPVKAENLHGKTVYFVDTDAIAACFEPGVTDELIKTIAGRKVLRAVFRDNSFINDAAKINVVEIFKQLSPSTEVKVI